MKAAVFLATGFEEVEAVGTIDVLRRGTMEAVSVSITGEKVVTGVHGISVIADELFEDMDFTDFDALVLPGGGPGSLMLGSHEGVLKALVKHYNEKKLVAAICASPRIFGKLGFLEGKRAVCYPGIEPELKGAILLETPAIADRNVITAKGPGMVFEFGIEILGYYDDILGPCAEKVAEDLLLIS
ncbi:MAG: DJ-1/PfpI family protein [Tannerella sp.]|jgi:4-methyl-5(b-hydroxyethyl)-thiazole monophosphate biosynthesis|nr:DJ-1/PfpI family protein [Tannerella sp.]